jgi:hypothetical protein
LRNINGTNKNKQTTFFIHKSLLAKKRGVGGGGGVFKPIKTLPLLNLVIYIFYKFMIMFTSYFMMSKAHEKGTFPKCNTNLATI